MGLLKASAHFDNLLCFDLPVLVTIIMLVKIISINIGGSAALQRLFRRALWETHAQCSQATEDSQPSDSPGNLENMPCGLAVITLAQREARPQPIWWGRTASSVFAAFHLLLPDRLRPPEEPEKREREREEKKAKVYKKKLLLWLRRGRSTIGLKEKERNQTASKG